MWLNETVASGMVPYFHFVGAENSFVEDRRWQEVGTEYFQWTAWHDAHLATRRSIANIGVVIGQSTQLLYPGPATIHSRDYMHETTQGLYDALLQARFAFDFVHEDRLEPERLAKYRALILPNVAMLSDHQCQQLRDYVHSGGSLMASFETSLYDENLKPRADFGLADLMGVSKDGDVVGTNGNPYSARIETAAEHPILQGFQETPTWIAGAQNRIPLKPLLSMHRCSLVVPGFCTRYPPELACIQRILTLRSQPSCCARQERAGLLRVSGLTLNAPTGSPATRDILRLLLNTIRWVSHDETIVHVDGPGFVEICFAGRLLRATPYIC